MPRRFGTDLGSTYEAVVEHVDGDVVVVRTSRVRIDAGKPHTEPAAAVVASIARITSARTTLLFKPTIRKGYPHDRGRGGTGFRPMFVLSGNRSPATGLSTYKVKESGRLRRSARTLRRRTARLEDNKRHTCRLYIITRRNISTSNNSKYENGESGNLTLPNRQLQQEPRVRARTHISAVPAALLRIVFVVAAAVAYK